MHMASPRKPIFPLDVKYEELDQYDYFDSALILKKQLRYGECIGLLLIAFSHLEHALDTALADLVSQRSHEMGFLIIKDLEFSQKIELFHALALPNVFYISKRKSVRTKQLADIRKNLENLSTFRNKVAHANWTTLDKDGFVRTDTKTDKIKGSIKFRKFKITPIIIMRCARDDEAGRKNTEFYGKDISIE